MELVEITDNRITKLKLEDGFPFHAYYKEFFYVDKDLGPEYEDKHGFKYKFFREYKPGVFIYEKLRNSNITCGC